MAELDIFCTKGEFDALLRGAVGKGYIVHVKRHLPTPNPALCESPEGLLTALGQGVHAFFLERKDVSRYPLALERIDKAGTTFWYERSKEGGPVIEAYFFAPFENIDGRFVACSLLTYHSKIINPYTGQAEAAGDSIKEAFIELVSGLKRVCRRVKATKRSALVSPGVDVLLRDGWSLAPPFEGL